MAPITLRNKSLPRRENRLSSIADIVHIMSWMRTGPLEDVLTPLSPLVGLLQLLAWSDIHRLVCTERAHCAYHQARTLLGYGRLKHALLPSTRCSVLDNCEVCMAKLHGYSSGCVMCDHALICVDCVTVISVTDLPMLPFPQFHRFFRAMKTEEATSPVRPGDVLCLVCYSARATEAQAHNLRMHDIYWGLSDGMLGTGAWRQPSSRSIRAVALTRSLSN